MVIQQGVEDRGHSFVSDFSDGVREFIRDLLLTIVAAAGRVQGRLNWALLVKLGLLVTDVFETRKLLINFEIVLKSINF